MKIIRIIFFSVLGLGLIVATGIFIFFQTFDTDQYLPQITQKASLALGRPVSIGHVGLGLSVRGITLDAGPLTVADDPGFTSQPFIQADRVRVSLDLRQLILKHEIHVTDILLEFPEIHFIRNQEGNINARSISQASPAIAAKLLPIGTAPPKAAAGIPHQEQADNRALSPVINTINITIHDAAISFIDQSQSMPVELWLLNINASLNGFSSAKPFQLSFNSSPLLLKSTASGMPDNPVFNNITGVVQFNMPHPETGTSGGISTTGGVIKNFNIIKTLLSRTLGSFGGLDDLTDKLGVGSNDTVIDKAEAKFSIHDKAVFINDFLLQTDIFELTATGSIDQGLNLDMQTVLHLNSGVSDTLVKQLDGLKFLYDDSKRITIGASLKGVIPHLKYKPNKDFRKQSKKAFMKEGGNILGLFFK